MKIRLFTIWGWRSGEDGPEMVEAWDEYSVDQNPEGYTEAVTRAAEQNEIRPDRIREIAVVVDYDAVTSAFYPAEVQGELLSEESA